MDEIPFVGEGIKKKVKEFLAEGKMSKLTNLQSDSKLTILETFNNVWGVGPAAASKIYSSGVRSIEQLRKKQESLLNDRQIIGLKYYEDFLKKIPRDEATIIA